MNERFSPEKDTVNRVKHGLFLAFGDAIVEDAGHIVLPTVRVEDGEERFKVIGLASGK
jgi:uncharacterized DUF497 family protein